MHEQYFDDFLWKPLAEGDYKSTIERCARQLDTTRAADAIHIGGLALVKMGRIADGFQWLEASLTLMRAKPEWFDNAANVLSEKKDYQRALTILERGLQYYPDHFRLNYVRAVMFSFMNRNEEALTVLHRLLKRHPESREVRLTLGYTLHMMARFEEALAQYDQIHDLPPNLQEELDNNRNGVYMDMGRHADALSVLKDNYTKDPTPTTVYNQSLIELGLNMWPEAWLHHRARPCLTMPYYVKRPLTLDEIKGKDLFFFAEQGFGDCIQFVRFAPILARHCRALSIGASHQLVRLFGTLPSNNKMDILPTGGTVGRFDVALPMLDAPALLNMTEATIPAEVPYFHLPTNMLPKWERRDMRPHVGIVWHGAARTDDPRAFSLNLRRSIDYEVFKPLLQGNEHITFVNLQVDEHPEDAPPNMISVIKSNFDMLDTAMVMNQLDLVITIDSALCHLAGAINKPVWMLSRFDGCWRWFWDGRETSPWYPSMRIFRQPAHNTWPQVVARVKEELEKLFP